MFRKRGQKNIVKVDGEWWTLSCGHTVSATAYSVRTGITPKVALCAECKALPSGGSGTDRVRKLREARRARGRCYHCERPAAEGVTTCAIHREYEKRRRTAAN